MNEKIDVIVVGGGPCGSFAALTAARLGAEVFVCEEHKEIGVPQHCAGHLSVAGLKQLGLSLPNEIIENEIKGAIFHSPSGKEFVVKRSSPVTYVVNRELFDKHLSDLATKSGAQYFLESRVESFLFDSGFVAGVALRKDRNKKNLTSKIVIDAEGCSSALLKKTGLTSLQGSMAVKAIQVEVDKVDKIEKDIVEVYLGRKFAPGFFAWIIPRRDASAKVGLATWAGDPREYLRQFMKDHPVASRKLRESNITSQSLHPIPLGGPIPKTCSNGLLVVGDAASQVKPTTGGGVIAGLLCSRIAGQTAYEAVTKNDCSATFLDQYECRWKKLVGFDLTVMRQIRKLLNSLSDDKIDRIIDLSAKLGVNNVLEKVGDLDFQGTSLISMIKNPSTLVVTLYSLFIWLTSSNRFNP